MPGSKCPSKSRSMTGQLSCHPRTYDQCRQFSSLDGETCHRKNAARVMGKTVPNKNRILETRRDPSGLGKILGILETDPIVVQKHPHVIFALAPRPVRLLFDHRHGFLDKVVRCVVRVHLEEAKKPT